MEYAEQLKSLKFRRIAHREILWCNLTFFFAIVINFMNIESADHRISESNGWIANWVRDKVWGVVLQLFCIFHALFSILRLTSFVVSRRQQMFNR